MAKLIHIRTSVTNNRYIDKNVKRKFLNPSGQISVMYAVHAAN